MMCFKDMSFCGSDCTYETCRRHFGEAEKRAAERWWGGPDAPVAFTDLRDGCPNYTTQEKVHEG